MWWSIRNDSSFQIMNITVYWKGRICYFLPFFFLITRMKFHSSSFGGHPQCRGSLCWQKYSLAIVCPLRTNTKPSESQKMTKNLYTGGDIQNFFGGDESPLFHCTDCCFVSRLNNTYDSSTDVLQEVVSLTVKAGQIWIMWLQPFSFLLYSEHPRHLFWTDL